MKIIVDTHALDWYLSDFDKLSKRAEDVLDNAEQIFVPTIVLLELLYLLIKKKQEKRFSGIFGKLKNDSKYTIVALDIAVLEVFVNLKTKFEMHDKIIVATSKMLDLPLVTKDETIQKVYKNTIW